MSNRELLEMAAKAARLNAFWNETRNCMELFTEEDHRYIGDWRPDSDDGESLRLAVRLNMSVEANIDSIYCVSIDADTMALSGTDSDCPEEFSEAKMGVVRLAVLRCAASIGRQMP